MPLPFILGSSASHTQNMGARARARPQSTVTTKQQHVSNTHTPTHPSHLPYPSPFKPSHAHADRADPHLQSPIRTHALVARAQKFSPHSSAQRSVPDAKLAKLGPRTLQVVIDNDLVRDARLLCKLQLVLGLLQALRDGVVRVGCAAAESAF